MARWWWAVALCVLGCAEDPDATSVDAEPRDRGVDARLIGPRDMALPDAASDPDSALGDTAVVDAVVDAGPQAACANGLDDDGDGKVDGDDPGCTGPEDNDEFNPPPQPACNDRADNDNDGLIDLSDPDCSSEADPTEAGGNAVTECSNGIDDDGNGQADWPYDPGCHAAGDVTEGAIDAAECANEQDDDGDGLIDYPRDPGCGGRGDRDEEDPDPPAACANGIDDDTNGLIDWPADPGCEAAGDPLEVGPCGDGVDVVDLNRYLAEHPAYDGTLEGAMGRSVGSCGGAAGGELYFTYRVDRPLEALRFSTEHAETQAPTVLYLRSSCQGPADQLCDRGTADRPGRTLTLDHPASGLYFLVVDTGSRDRVGPFRLTVEAEGPPACRDTEDNDDDGLTDLADPGCAEPNDRDEQDPAIPALCADGLDNDGDGHIDWPDDPDCAAAGADREEPLCPLAVGGVIEVGQAGGNFELPVLPRGPGVANGACELGPSPEILLVVTLTDPSDVAVDVLDAAGVPAQVAIHLRRACVDPATEVVCRRGGDMGPMTAIGLDRGVYFVFVEQGFLEPAAPRTAQVVIRSNIHACNNLVDDDGDGRIDQADAGCETGLDDSEIDPAMVPECADGLDNDADGRVDWPDDDGCAAAGDRDEAPFCMAVNDVVQVPPQGGRFMINTTNRPDRYQASCAAGAAGGEQVFSINLGVAATLTAEMIQGDFDTALYLRSVCDDENAEIVCDDDGGNGVLSRISIRLQPGTYFLFADGFGGDSGTGTLQISLQ